MQYLLVRQECADYPQWRASFDQHADARREFGIDTVLVSRNTDEPSEVIVLFQLADVERVQEYFRSATLRDAHRAAGVRDGTTRLTFLRTHGNNPVI